MRAAVNNCILGVFVLVLIGAVLKVIGYIHLPWWLVTIPVWGPIVLFFWLLAVVGIFCFLEAQISNLRKDY